METVAISEFKARCLAILEQVLRTGEPVLVTRRGEPIAEVVPPATPARARGWLDAAAGSGRILGDLVEPVVGPDEWEATR